MIRAFIQARMSSARFPGKVLAPLKGQPVIGHVISRVLPAISLDQITVATSVSPSDDPLALYVRHLGVSVFRGPLDDVFQRLQGCLKEHPCSWFFRICADSPFLEADRIHAMIPYANGSKADLVTNVFPRSFPRGLSLEMLRSERFAGIDPRSLSDDEKEHVTRVYYNHPEAFQIINLPAGDSPFDGSTLAIDSLEDLVRLEQHSGKLL